MSFDEFMMRVGWGEEFSFVYKKNDYWISTIENGYVLNNEGASFEMKFKNSKEFFEKARIDGKRIFEIWPEIQRTVV